MTLAKSLIDAAVAAKADAVKFQTFKAERLASAAAPKAAYQLQRTDCRESQLDMLRRLELSEDAHRELMVYGAKRGVLVFSTPFEETSVDLLERVGVCAFKIASGELTNLPLLEYVARKGKPMIVSTGMSTLAEVEAAVRTVRAAGNEAIILLQCVSNYPADPAEANLRVMRTMADAFHVPVGYSDHTPGIEVALAAVALAACVIEKHVTLDRALPGPDHHASLEPAELKALVQGIRRVEAALGHGRKEPAPSEGATAAVARKSVVAARHIPRGAALTMELLSLKRPGTGLPPSALPAVLGRKAEQEIPADTVLTWEMIG
jgi:N-acetylneuraminate synthase